MFDFGLDIAQTLFALGLTIALCAMYRIAVPKSWPWIAFATGFVPTAVFFAVFALQISNYFWLLEFGSSAYHHIPYTYMISPHETFKQTLLLSAPVAAAFLLLWPARKKAIWS